MNLGKIIFSEVLNVIRKKNYHLLGDGKPYNINLFGVRTVDNSDGFDDLIGVIYQDTNMNWTVETFEATTKPGVYWREHPMTPVLGTGILKEGEYLDCWQKGWFNKLGYNALLQTSITKPMVMLLDTNEDAIIDYNTKNEKGGIFGIELHHAGAIESTVNYNWSAGCQVTARKDDHDRIMELITLSIEQGRYNLFGYRLFNMNDFK